MFFVGNFVYVLVCSNRSSILKVPSIVFDRIEGRPVVKLGVGREVSLGNYCEILLFFGVGTYCVT